MYKHLLVPVDDSTLSTALVTQAVRHASETGAKITFFHAVRDYLATGEGALMHAMSPAHLREKIAGDAHTILNKAQAAARAAQVEADTAFRIGNDVSDAILATAQERGCDLIFTMMRGPVSVGTLSLGSQTFRLASRSPIPVLIAAVARNSPSPEMDTAIAIIEDEHRSLAAVLHAAKRLLAEAEREGVAPDFAMLKQMLFYIRKFPEALHHPKEEQHLFECLRQRTREADETLAVLYGHHTDRSLLNELDHALAAYSGGAPESASRFARALEAFSKAEFRHMALEESAILPMARKYLTREDWASIAAAFEVNKTPSFDDVADELFKDIFSRIMLNASPASPLAGATVSH